MKPVGRRWEWLLIAAIVATFFLIRAYRSDFPLERDEGEYAYAGQLLLEGKLPYVHLYNMKLPGAYATNALMLAALGQTVTGVHLGHAVFNLLTMLLIWQIGRRLDRPLTGLAAAAFFGMLSINRNIMGLHAHAEHFLVFWMLLGVLLLPAIRTRSRWRMLAGGICLGLALLMKQHALVFIGMVGLWVIGERYRLRRDADVPGVRATVIDGLLCLGGWLLPYLVVCLAYASAGAFGKFWFWTFDYARAYATLTPADDFARALKTGVGMASHTVWPLWIFCLWGLTVLTFGKRHRNRLAFVLILLFGAAATVPGFYFRPQYFVMFLPGLCLLGGLFLATVVDWIPDKRLRYLPVLVPLIMIAAFFYQLRSYYFLEPPEVAVRQLYGINPFAESLELADWLREHSDPDDRLVVLGSEPQVYFYSRRPAATGYIYAYPLLEEHEYARQMTQEMIAEVEAGKPEWVVFTNVWTSWFKQTQGTTEIESWVAQYRKQYDPVLLIEIYHDRPNRRFLNNTIVVDPEVKAQRKYPGAPFIALYKRRADE